MPLLLNLLPARFLLTLREWFDYKISHCVLTNIAIALKPPESFSWYPPHNCHNCILSIISNHCRVMPRHRNPEKTSSWNIIWSQLNKNRILLIPDSNRWQRESPASNGSPRGISPWNIWNEFCRFFSTYFSHHTFFSPSYSHQLLTIIVIIVFIIIIVIIIIIVWLDHCYHCNHVLEWTPLNVSGSISLLTATALIVPRWSASNDQ